jgi:hypothetical protein
MSTIEDRLTAALSARADTVQPEDLPYVAPPSPPRVNRPLLYGLAAAACAALVAVPFLVSDPSEDTPAPPATEAPDPSPTPTIDVPGADWPQVDASNEYDVEGDGEPDRVVTRTETGENLTQDPWRVEAQLSSGGVAAILMSGQGWEIGLVDAVDLDDDGDDEIVVYNGQQTEEIGVLDLEDGALVERLISAEPGITSQPDDRFRLRGWWAEDGQFLSYRSVEGGFVPGTNGPRPPHDVDVWRWTLSGGKLVAVEEEPRCLDESVEEHPYPC